MGMLSVSDPESELKPPPWRQIRTLAGWRGVASSGVMSRMGTPATVRDSMWTGKAAAEASPARACHVSVPDRRSARVS